MHSSHHYDYSAWGRNIERCGEADSEGVAGCIVGARHRLEGRASVEAKRAGEGDDLKHESFGVMIGPDCQVSDGDLVASSWDGVKGGDIGS